MHALQYSVADVNLEEEEVLKLASLGNESNSKDTVDILRKSLVIRNKYVLTNVFDNFLNDTSEELVSLRLE